MRTILKTLLTLTAASGFTLTSAYAQLPYPTYSAASIANSATNLAGSYAPNTFISIYGQNLSSATQGISATDIRASTLPTSLSGIGVRVLINHQPGNIFFVSPNQVNVLIPIIVTPGPTLVQLVNDGRDGPEVTIKLDAAAPALFPWEDSLAIATHGLGPLVTREQPAQRGELVVLYAGGLGPTIPTTAPNQIPQVAARLVRTSAFQVRLNGVPVDPSNILYAGVTPGSAGLFQINLKIPDDAPDDPDVQVGFADQLSPPGRLLPLR